VVTTIPTQSKIPNRYVPITNKCQISRSNIQTTASAHTLDEVYKDDLAFGFWPLYFSESFYPTAAKASIIPSNSAKICFPWKCRTWAALAGQAVLQLPHPLHKAPLTTLTWRLGSYSIAP
jgi:hypothetical protein